MTTTLTTPEARLAAIKAQPYAYADSNDERVILNSENPAKDALLEIQTSLQDNGGASFETTYSIMRDACVSIEEIADGEEGITPDSVDEYLESNDNHASVYTSTRLEWLTGTNENLISDIMRECGEKYRNLKLHMTRKHGARPAYQDA